MQKGRAGWCGCPRILWPALRAVRVLAVGRRRTGGGSGSWESRIVVLCLVAVLVPLSGGMSPSWAQPAEGDLRIIPLADMGYEGRLEIYYDGEWGGICDDFWGIADARVACKELGYPGAEEALRELEGPPNTSIWLDSVNCTGSEESLTQGGSPCGHAGWGPHNPRHCSDQGEYAGVECKTGKNVVFNKRHLTVNEEGSDTYQVWLSEMPTGDVTVAISSDNTDVTVDKSSLTFTTGNYEMEQTVMVTAGDDNDKDDDAVTLTHTASGGGYSGTKDVTVTVKDNDVPGVSINPRELTIGEGANDSYTVVLTGKPTAPVTITVSGHADPSVSVNPTSLMFTTMNWNTAQTVEVTAEEDTDTDSETVTLTHSASGGGYDSVSIDSVTVQVQGKPDQVAKPTVTGQSTTELEVSWTAPANNGAVITAYTVQYRKSGTNTHGNHESTTRLAAPAHRPAERYHLRGAGPGEERAGRRRLVALGDRYDPAGPPWCADGDGRVGHKPDGELDIPGRQRRVHHLRRTVPAGRDAVLGGLVTYRVGHDHDDYRSAGGHGLLCTGAGQERRGGERMVIDREWDYPGQYGQYAGEWAADAERDGTGGRDADGGHLRHYGRRRAHQRHLHL